MERFYKSTRKNQVRHAGREDDIADKTIMLVSSEHYPRRELWQLITGAGIADIWQLCAVSEAVRMLDEDPGSADLIVCDLDLPDGGAIDLICYISESWVSLPVANISAGGQKLRPGADQLCGRLGLNFIGAYPKPLTESALRSMMLRATGRPRLRVIP